MNPVWTDECGCTQDAAVCKPGFTPTFFVGPSAEGKAIAHHVAAVRHLHKFGGPTHWAFHANGRHFLGMSEGRRELEG